MTVVNPWHWLDEDGGFPDDPRLRRKSIRVAQCIEYGGKLNRGEARPTLLPCAKTPAGAACSGFLLVLKQSDDAILAFCPVCTEDEFLIYEWEDTPWAIGHADPLDIAAFSKAQGFKVRRSGPVDHEMLLQRGLDILGSPLSAGEVREALQRASQMGTVVDWVLSSLPSPPTQGSLERFVPLLMDIWDQTSKDARDDRSHIELNQVHTLLAQAELGRNQICPCGSGRLYKRCCLTRTNLH